MNITKKQCRAARALLNISQNELAEAIGIGRLTIVRYESEDNDTAPSLSTLDKITTYFNDCGIEFLDHDGVRLSKDTIRTYEGVEIHRILLNEIYHDMKDSGGEILIKNLTEQKWDNSDSEAFLKNHLDRLIKANITERILVSEDDSIYVAPKHWYKKMPAQYFSSQTQWIFKDKVAMVTWGDIENLIIIKSPVLFTSETKNFNCLWNEVAKKVD